MLLTLENYFSVFDASILDELDSEYRVGHDFFAEATDNGTDFSIYHADQTTRENIDMYLEMINEYLASKKKVQPDEPPKVKPAKSEVIPDASVIPSLINLYHKSPFNNEDGHHRTKSEDQKDQEDEEHKRQKVIRAKKEKVPKPRKTRKEKPIPKQKQSGSHDSDYADPPSTKKRLRTPGKKTSRVSKPRINVKSRSVEKLDDGTRFIQRYIALHGKTKTVGQLLPLIKSLQKSILEKRIGKSYKYAKQIKTIQDQLVRIYNKYDESVVLDPIIIEEPNLSDYVRIAGGEKVYRSITFLKRIVGLQGKKPDKKSLMALSDSITRAGISNDDPYLPKLKEMIGLLKKSYQSGDSVGIGKQELNGLCGIVKKCGCSHCNHNTELGTIYNKPVKNSRQCRSKKYSDANAGACSYHRGLKPRSRGLGDIPTSMSAQDMMELEVEQLPFTGKWQALFGKPASGFKMMIHGGPGSGKSSLLLELAHYFATSFGNVLYVTSEEYTPATLKPKLAVLPNVPSNLIFASSVFGQDIGAFKFVFLDSVNHMKLSYDQFLALTKKFPGVSFIYILQHIKSGSFRGGMDFEHEADIAAEVSNYKISVYKNRFGVKGVLNFYDPYRDTRP